MNKIKSDAPESRNPVSIYFKRYWQLYLLLALPMLYLLIFKYIPMVYIQIAFKKYSIVESIWKQKIAANHGFQYFIQAFSDSDFRRALRNTLVLNLLDLAIDVEDTAVAKIDFASGARGVFFATLANSYNAGPFLEIRTEKAIFQIDSRKLYQLDESGERQLIVEDKALEGSKFYYGSSHGRLIRKFYDAILQDTDDYVHVKDARLSNQVIDAIVRSGVIGKEIIF